MFTKRYERKSKFEVKKSTISGKYVCLFYSFYQNRILWHVYSIEGLNFVKNENLVKRKVMNKRRNPWGTGIQ